MNQLTAGSIFDGKYEVLSRIGGGGMGEVYRVRHVHLDETRVIKLLRPDLASSAHAAERFQLEARLATQVKHPRVATLHDYSRLEDGSFYMVWESIDGRDVDHWVRDQGTFPVDIAIQLGVQGLSGLEAIHHAHIVHRDISPDNVMITTDARGRLGMKIIDLGLAGDIREILGSSAAEGLVGGKVNYCSPEHVGLFPGVRPDSLSDVFGFAIVLYFMISGQLPFDRVAQPSDIAGRFQKGAYPLASQPGVEVGRDLSNVLEKALRVDREQRFESATEFREALQGLVAAPARAPRPQPQVEIDDVVRRARSALEGRRFDEFDGLLEGLLEIAPSDPRVLELRSQREEVRSKQRQLQTMQLREMLNQYLQAGQEPMARMALQSLLELDPNCADRSALEERLERLGASTRTSQQAKELAARLRSDLQKFADQPAQLAAGAQVEFLQRIEAQIAELAELDSALAHALANEVGDFRQGLEREQLVERQKGLIRALIDGRRLDEAEVEIERLAALRVPKVAVDLVRRDLATIRRELAREAKIALIEQELPRAIERKAYKEARELAFELQQEDPKHPAVTRFLEQVSREEEALGKQASAREGAATVTALLEAKRFQEAKLALEVLRRIDPAHSLIPHFERRLRNSVGSSIDQA